MEGREHLIIPRYVNQPPLLGRVVTMLWTENIYDVQESALAALIMREDCNCFDVAPRRIGVGDFVRVTGYIDSSLCWIDDVWADVRDMETSVERFLMEEWNRLTSGYGFDDTARRCEVWRVVPDVAHVCEVTDVDVVDVCDDASALAHTLLHVDWRDTMDGATGKAAIIVWNDGMNSLSVSPDWQGCQPELLEDAVEDAAILNRYGWPWIGSLGKGDFDLCEDADYIMDAARAWADSVMASSTSKGC